MKSQLKRCSASGRRAGDFDWNQRNNYKEDVGMSGIKRLQEVARAKEMQNERQERSVGQIVRARVSDEVAVGG
jgi:hypothetical protein